MAKIRRIFPARAHERTPERLRAQAFRSFTRNGCKNHFVFLVLSRISCAVFAL